MLSPRGFGVVEPKDAGQAKLCILRALFAGVDKYFTTAVLNGIIAIRRKCQFWAGGIAMRHTLLALIRITLLFPCIWNQAGTARASDPNLVAHWTLDEGTGIIAYDSAGNNNGAIYGATWTTGKIGGALSFNGTSNYVDCGSGPSNYDNITVSAWMKTSTKGVLVSNRDAGGSYGTWYSLYSTSIEIGDNSQGGFRNVTFYTPTLNGLWHHIVYTKDGINHAIYVDGSLDQNFTSNADISQVNPMFIGRRWNRSNDVFWFNGIIDDVRIYNRALSAGEILQLFFQSYISTKAYNPNPANNSANINPDTVLSWKPGGRAASHDVYLGTNFNEVNDADILSSEYIGTIDVNAWDPCGLDSWTTYYWRIDEVNDSNLWKGDVWSFETGGSAIELSATQFEFRAVEGGANPAGQILSITNSGTGTLHWQITENCEWLEAVPLSGSCTDENDQVEITVDSAALPGGNYECDLTIYDNAALNSPQTVHVKLRVSEMPPSEYWRDYIEFPDDLFKSDVISENDPGWIKFTMILAPPYSPSIVYFQDSKEYPFHYDFATEFLTPFVGMSAQEYYNVTLYDANQQVALGAVIMPANPAIKDYGIQLIRYDAYTKEETANLFNTVKANIIAQPDVNAFYFPSYEQLSAAEANSAWLEAQGIPISSTARWAAGNACYSAGWALGTLKYFDGNQIQSAYEAGQLLPGDILLTDGVPAEVPFVAGILSLLPSTPSSHVAMLARTFGVPFGHLAIAADANHAQQLIGRLVIVSVSEIEGVGNIKITDMTGLLTEEQIDQILAVKKPKPLNITAMEPYSAYSANTNGLEPNDIRYFGGKAANFGMLRRSVPENCPNAVALSFQLWNEFLDQTLASGKTLREEINSRLSVYTYPPSNLPALYADLRYIREELFTKNSATSFTQQQMDSIISILQDPNYGFGADRNIRFRSSTNVEDTNQFSGAGLYDSFSGCLADDIDGDTQGPCICDPVESKERGVFRAIRKVFASFYNDNAFLERLRHGVDENDVGMGILVHHSSPDQFELANGVATLEKRQGDPNRYIKLVTQKGAVSVANPDDGSIPEEVTVVYKSESDIELTLVRSSNLVILGETVLDWPADYNGFASLLAAASEEFETETGKTDYLLDLEYKKLLPGGSLPNGGLAIKQIREIPKPDQSVTAKTPFLVNEPVTYVAFQGEIWGTSLLYSCHRLKSRWNLNTKNMWLTPENLAQSIYSDVSIEYAAQGRIRTIKGKLSLLPDASHSFAGTAAADSFIMHHLSNPRTYTLTTNNVITQVGPADSPIVKLSDFVDPFWAEMDRELDVSAVYSRPPWPGEPTQDNIQIMAEPSDDSFRSRLIYSHMAPVSLYTTFYLAPYDGFHGTLSLSRFVETTITGFTTEPIVLHGYYSQTYGPGRHNFTEQFLFEPRLEPGISQSILAELEAQNIHLIYAKYPMGEWPDSGNLITLSYDELPFLVSDIDGNNKVDFVDFSRLGSKWLYELCGQCEGADLTGDGRVDMDDLFELGQEWLKEL